jgi:hypothetical protein
MEVSRHHADHEPWISIENDLAADDRGVTSKLRLPDPVAEDYWAGGALALFARVEEASHHRVDADDREKIGSDDAAF